MIHIAPGPKLYPHEDATERVNITVPKAHADKAREISIAAGASKPGNVGLGYRIVMQEWCDRNARASEHGMKVYLHTPEEMKRIEEEAKTPEE